MGLLRSADWLAAQGVRGVGDRAGLDLPELDVEGEFRVVAIGECPEIETGPGPEASVVGRSLYTNLHARLR